MCLIQYTSALNRTVALKVLFYFYLTSTEFKHADVISSSKTFQCKMCGRSQPLFSIYILQLWLLKRFITQRLYVKTFIIQASAPSVEQYWIFTFLSHFLLNLTKKFCMTFCRSKLLLTEWGHRGKSHTKR